VLANTATQSKEQHRYFNAAELREVFTLPDMAAAASQTALQLARLHPITQRSVYQSLNDELNFVHSLGELAMACKTIWSIMLRY
jgi:hypothetical protein